MNPLQLQPQSITASSRKTNYRRRTISTTSNVTSVDQSSLVIGSPPRLAAFDSDLPLFVLSESTSPTKNILISSEPNVNPHSQPGLLSPCSSQSSVRSSTSLLNSPVQIRISNLRDGLPSLPVRRSLNYEISQILEKRFEDDRNAVNYSEKLQLSFRQSKKTQSLSRSTALPQPILSILKKKKPNIISSQPSPLQPTIASFTTSQSEKQQINSSKTKQSPLTGNCLKWSDRKSLEKMTRLNTELNSVVQPENSIEVHFSYLSRCQQHSKRICNLFCTEETCKKAQKFGCIICFSSANSSQHSFHSYETISSKADLDALAEQQRDALRMFIDQTIEQEFRKVVQQQVNQTSNSIKDLLYDYVRSINDTSFIQVSSVDQIDPTIRQESIRLFIDSFTRVATQNLSRTLQILLREEHMADESINTLSFFNSLKKSPYLLQFSTSLQSLNESVLNGILASQTQFDLLQRLSSNVLCEISQNKITLVNDTTSSGFFETTFEHQKTTKNGKGIQFNKDGSYFEGDFKNDQYHGIGRSVSRIGEMYIGAFKKGHRQGVGTLVHPNGDVYTGEFSKNDSHGTGKMVYKTEGSTYTGGWAKNMRQGKGKVTQTSNNNLIEEGVYQEGKLVKTTINKEVPLLTKEVVE